MGQAFRRMGWDEALDGWFGGALLPAAALAQAPAAAPAEVPIEMEVVVTVPLAGSEVERGKVPVNTAIVRGVDLQRTGPASALRSAATRQ